LRLREGFAPVLFQRRTGLVPQCLAARLSSLAGRGLLEQSGESWRATESGFQFLNEVVAAFLPDQKSQTAARS
jgi:coproporphyrinogen III oxidase-like Fe-S oxidoreductase